jgi:hypothetical protein
VVSNLFFQFCSGDSPGKVNLTVYTGASSKGCPVAAMSLELVLRLRR